MTCTTCDEPRYVQRQGENHFDVAFGDYPMCIELDGEDVSNRCIGAWAGPDGSVELWDYDEAGHPAGHPIMCRTDHPRTTRHHGFVRVTRLAGVAAP